MRRCYACGKVKFVIDPAKPLSEKRTIPAISGYHEGRQRDRGAAAAQCAAGAQEPLTRQDVTDKFALNAQHGGWTAAQSDATLKLLADCIWGKSILSSLRA